MEERVINRHIEELKAGHVIVAIETPHERVADAVRVASPFAARIDAPRIEVMSVIQIAMRAGLPYTGLRDMVFAHPTMAEALNDLLEQLE